VIKLLASNVLVLAAPTAASSGGLATNTDNNANAVLRVSTQNAATFAYAADNGTLYLVLRPQVGAKPTPPSLVTIKQLLAGKPAVGG
jgi:Flp pilus assembly protein CpaB